MPSIIQAGNAASTGLVTTGATDGILELRSGTAAGGTVAMTVDAAQNLVLAKGISVGASAAPAFSAHKNATVQSISPVTFTKVTYETEEFDTGNNFSASRFTPLVAGYYAVTACTYVQAASSLSRVLTALYKNGVSLKFGNDNTTVSANDGRGALAATVYLNGSTDYIEIFALCNGTTLTLVGGSGGDNTYFQAFLARSA